MTHSDTADSPVARWKAALAPRHTLGPIVAGLLAALAPAPQASTAPPDSATVARPRNLILLVGDGMGPAYLTLGREVLGRPLLLDTLLVGSAATGATDTRVTDSAAASTALATGVRTRNGAIAVDVDGRRLRTLVEAAEADGRATGLVTTSRVTHATPAAFAAHVLDRGEEAAIARQLMDAGLDVLLGGGRREFEPDSSGRRWDDGDDLIARARSRGVPFADDSLSLAAASEGPLLGLFASSHLDYVLDRAPGVPDLPDMARAALDRLAGDPDGFVLLVEGGRIDHAGHANDAAAAARELLEFDEALRVARDFARSDGRTLLVVTADHETGGLSLGASVRGESRYEFRPGVLRGVRRSAGAMARAIHEGEVVDAVLRRDAGLSDLSARDIEAVTAAPAEERALAIARLIDGRAVIGWTTLGHTAVDVPVGAWGPGAERFRGHRHLADIGREMAALLGLSIGTISKD